MPRLQVSYKVPIPAGLHDREIQALNSFIRCDWDFRNMRVSPCVQIIQLFWQLKVFRLGEASGWQDLVQLLLKAEMMAVSAAGGDGLMHEYLYMYSTLLIQSTIISVASKAPLPFLALR